MGQPNPGTTLKHYHSASVAVYTVRTAAANTEVLLTYLFT